ncbi:hypothetical protein D3C76_1487660 [compost metagenome]
MEEIGEILQRLDRAAIERGAQAPMGILAIGRCHPILAGVQLTGQVAPGFIGIGPGPLLGTQQHINDALAGTEVLLQQVDIHGQGARRAVVRANQRVRVGAGVDHHPQAELVG